MSYDTLRVLSRVCDRSIDLTSTEAREGDGCRLRVGRRFVTYDTPLFRTRSICVCGAVTFVWKTGMRVDARFMIQLSVTERYDSSYTIIRITLLVVLCNAGIALYIVQTTVCLTSMAYIYLTRSSNVHVDVYCSRAAQSEPSELRVFFWHKPG